MKKSLALFLSVLSFSVLADPQFNQITKDEVEDVSKEFGTNFAHTAVAAPETDGIWGVEVGIVGGQTASPEFSDVVDRSGGDGKDFKNVMHAALMARAHFPLDFFAEVTVLPEQEISDVKIKSNSFSAGWNIGRFTKLPLDITLGYDHSTGEINFHQDADATTTPITPEANIDLKTTTTVMWVGVSKTFAIVTPYLKIGTSKIEGDLDANANIFNVGGQQSESVSLSGGYLAIGANVQLLVFRLGLEATQMQDTKRISGKFSFAF